MNTIDNVDLPANVQTFVLTDDGTFPNSRLPLIVYPTNDIVGNSPAPEDFERIFAQHRWPVSWRNGVYAYHHYHSTAHELLGCYSGNARVLFGGPEGVEIDFVRGYAVLIPAGVAHKCMIQSGDFGVVAAYPPGQAPDMQYGNSGERPAADEAIANVPTPASDPLLGDDGPVSTIWEQTRI